MGSRKSSRCFAEREFQSGGLGSALAEVDRRWNELGHRPRNWPIDLLELALREHTGQWQETYVRLLMAYREYDRGHPRRARYLMEVAVAQAREGFGEENHVYVLLLRMELLFFQCRSGHVPESAYWTILAVQQKMIQRPGLFGAGLYRTRAAMDLALRYRETMGFLDEAESILRDHSNAERDNIRAELEWVAAMRHEASKMRWHR